MEFNAVELIELKRDGGGLPGEAIAWLIDSYTDGEVPDYQMAALLMAIFHHGLDEAELGAWTEAMLHSGEVMDLSGIGLPKVDKHSTGGVGDKVSIPLAPIVAACGVAVPMMSGRGLGHTGGTLDKLESIPGYTTGLEPERFRSILSEHGVVLAGQSEAMVPADREIYSLRDATATVPSIPLIASSIMSKKLAEDLDGLLLDVKQGSGAFMEDIEEARRLAKTMVGIGSTHGVEVVAFITAMDQPLGREVGNANEVRESIEVLRGEGPADLTELTLTFAEAMLQLGGVPGGLDRVMEAVESGAAVDKFRGLVAAHGGDPAVIEQPERLPRARHSHTIEASRAGYVHRCDARTIGIASTRMGAGRQRKEDGIDHGVGITLHAKIGDQVAQGEALATVAFNDPDLFESQHDRLASAWSIGEDKTDVPKLIVERVS
ncbi:MAG: thymidine phosphorylase [Actinobacteria bacterium]|nr:thymidine phosphorylase [Actinomycetota bacterium]